MVKRYKDSKGTLHVSLDGQTWLVLTKHFQKRLLKRATDPEKILKMAIENIPLNKGKYTLILKREHLQIILRKTYNPIRNRLEVEFISITPTRRIDPNLKHVWITT